MTSVPRCHHRVRSTEPVMVLTMRAREKRMLSTRSSRVMLSISEPGNSMLLLSIVCLRKTKCRTTGSPAAAIGYQDGSRHCACYPASFSS